MKTKINFSINSKEITKQIIAVVTAEAKAEARKIAQKQFEKELERKIAAIIKAVDNDVSPSYWKESELRRLIVETVRKTLAETYKNNAEVINKLAEKNINDYLLKIERYCNEKLRQVDAKIEKAVNDKLNELAGNALIKTLINSGKTGV